MKCDRCDREATIEEVTKVGQTYVYKHLCEACAADEGLGASSAAKKTTVVSVKAAPGPSASQRRAKDCVQCGMSFGEFRDSGRLGCPGCYEAFEHRLGPMIERAQEGGTHHIGKTPKRMLSSIPGEGPDRMAAMERLLGETKQRREKLERLGRQLQAALAGERFEQAALIRDEMRRLREGLVGAKPGGVGPEPE
ncbi:MAG: UvrB/UvrC motif-containing protein, partial [Planctomycetota bacterium]